MNNFLSIAQFGPFNEYRGHSEHKSDFEVEDEIEGSEQGTIKKNVQARRLLTKSDLEPFWGLNPESVSRSIKSAVPVVWTITTWTTIQYHSFVISTPIFNYSTAEGF